MQSQKPTCRVRWLAGFIRALMASEAGFWGSRDFWNRLDPEPERLWDLHLGDIQTQLHSPEQPTLMGTALSWGVLDK